MDSYVSLSIYLPLPLVRFVVVQYIESLLRKYIGEYVACQMCRSFNTALTRDNVSRLFFVSCQVLLLETTKHFLLLTIPRFDSIS